MSVDDVNSQLEAALEDAAAPTAISANGLQHQLICLDEARLRLFEVSHGAITHNNAVIDELSEQIEQKSAELRELEAAYPADRYAPPTEEEDEITLLREDASLKLRRQRDALQCKCADARLALRKLTDEVKQWSREAVADEEDAELERLQRASAQADSQLVKLVHEHKGLERERAVRQQEASRFEAIYAQASEALSRGQALAKRRRSERVQARQAQQNAEARLLQLERSFAAAQLAHKEEASRRVQSLLSLQASARTLELDAAAGGGGGASGGAAAPSRVHTASSSVDAQCSTRAEEEAAGLSSVADDAVADAEALLADLEMEYAQLKGRDDWLRRKAAARVTARERQLRTELESSLRELARVSARSERARAALRAAAAALARLARQRLPVAEVAHDAASASAPCSIEAFTHARDEALPQLAAEMKAALLAELAERPSDEADAGS